MRAEQHRAAADELVARLEARPERVEGACEEEEEDEKTDWRGVAQLDLEDSDEEPLYEDPRQHAWSGLPQDLREVPKHETVEALRSNFISNPLPGASVLRFGDFVSCGIACGLAAMNENPNSKSPSIGNHSIL